MNQNSHSTWIKKRGLAKVAEQRTISGEEFLRTLQIWQMLPANVEA